ncbi:MAG: hypothetical protein H7244_01005 [Herminiimonas sp.]|nr:hypothetical protein [Herminiimonas sp.]
MRCSAPMSRRTLQERQNELQKSDPHGADRRNNSDGSIVLPCSANGLAGIKPPVRLASRSGIIPISASQDSAGPMARCVFRGPQGRAHRCGACKFWRPQRSSDDCRGKRIEGAECRGCDAEADAGTADRN